MREYLVQPFLTEYYLLESVCGGFWDEEEKNRIFDLLAEVFCITDREVLELYRYESFREHFADITDHASYERFCRTVEFAKKCGQDLHFTDVDRVILAQKRAAMAVRSDVFGNVKTLTRESIADTLMTKARGGNVDAMLMLSFMEYHGIFVCKDEARAIKRVRICARWNSLFGNLMGLKYDRENRTGYINNIFTVSKTADQKQTYEHICKVYRYKNEGEKCCIASILEKAFELGIIKRGVYDRGFASVAFSTLISAEDKKKILLCRHKDAVAALSDIPFDIRRGEKNVFDNTAVERLPLCRASESEKILQNFTVAARCPSEVYMPLLIVANDEFVANMYGKMLKDGFADASIVEFDAGTLGAQDFAPTKENIFLRGLSETKNSRTLFVFKHCEELSMDLIEQFEDILDYENRRKFKLFQPSVSLDLSDIMIVMFASERTSGVNRIAERCDTVISSRISDAEKPKVVEAMLGERTRSYGCEGLTLEDGCAEYLAHYDTKRIHRIIDGVLKSVICSGADKVTLDLVKKVCGENSIKGSESVRIGFGYIGGENNA